MSLHLVFSWFADGGAWPEYPGEKSAVVDAAVVGPHGFLDHLETMLGLGAPAVAGVKRIATYLNKLKCAGAGNFWSRSFSADPWSTAREVLVWRDQLVEAGWGPEIAVATGRLGDLARAETSGPVLPVGFSNRLRQVIQVLATPRSLPLASVALIDARADLPAGWRRLLDRLEACGVAVTSQLLACVQHVSGDLSRLLAPFDAEGQRPEFTGDGGVALLTADTELVAAEALAAWLAADKAGNENLVFILGKDSDLLDHALRRAGLPRLGASATSAHRALLQVLPLAFSLAWNPPDPQALLDFLLLPASPLPRWAANMLARCVAETPGVGGAPWQETFQRIAVRLVEKLPDESEKKRSEIVGLLAGFRRAGKIRSQGRHAPFDGARPGQPRFRLGGRTPWRIGRRTLSRLGHHRERFCRGDRRDRSRNIGSFADRAHDRTGDWRRRSRPQRRCGSGALARGLAPRRHLGRSAHNRLVAFRRCQRGRRRHGLEQRRAGRASAGRLSA